MRQVRGRVRAVCQALPGPPASARGLREYQSLQLRRLVRHAAAEVPYYRDLFAAARLDPATFRGLEDLPHIPYTNRRTLMDLPAEAVLSQSARRERLLEKRTTGSSGEPLRFRCGRFEDTLLALFRQRTLWQLGLRFRDRLVKVRIPPRRPPGPVLRLLNTLGCLRIQYVDSRESDEAVAGILRSLRPDAMVGLPGLLSLVAGRWTDQDRRGIRPRFVVLGGDTITPRMEERVAAAFGAPVYQSYACFEANLLAWTCRWSRVMHVLDESVVLEVLQGDRPVEDGETGEVVITALHLFEQPFIRYRLGDLAVRFGEEPCPCGRRGTRLGRVEGRKMDRILLPDGRLVSADQIFMRLERLAPWARRYQLYQPDRVHVELRVVGPAPADTDLERLQVELAPVLGQGLRFLVRQVEELPVGPGGKWRFCHSLVLSEFEEQPEPSAGTRSSTPEPESASRV